MSSRAAVWSVALLLGMEACDRSATAPLAGCSYGVLLARVAPIELLISDTLLMTVYDTITVDDPSIAIPPSGRLLDRRSATGRATVSPFTVRAYNHKLPASVIPIAFFLRGASVGADTIIVTTSIVGPECGAGATARIPVTVVP